jgi:YfiH family protein
MAGVVTAEFEILEPDWPAPAGVNAAVTTRTGGVSQGDFASLNLADHVNDAPDAVDENRKLLQQHLQLTAKPAWLQQVHGAEVVQADGIHTQTQADAAWTRTRGLPCVVLTADCLPVLFCDRNATIVAAAHAGWRGLNAGVLQNTLAVFTAVGIAPKDVLVWLGPAIGQDNYEIDDQVRDPFFLRDPESDFSFRPTRPGHWQFDIYRMARRFLWGRGVTEVSGGEYCTYADPRFFSYRRQGQCGRQATMIWLSD